MMTNAKPTMTLARYEELKAAYATAAATVDAAPDVELTVTARDGVCLRSEEE